MAERKSAVTLHPILASYVPVIRGLAEALGPDYELVLHDTSVPEHSIVAIEHGYVTGRTVGGAVTDYARFLLARPEVSGSEYVANSLTRTRDGRRIRTTTIFIRDEKGAVIGYLCVNFDMARAEALKAMADHLTGVRDDSYSEVPRDEGPPGRMDELVERNLKLMRRRIGKPLRLSTRQEKLEAMRILDGEGFFRLKGAVETLAREMGNTKYTVYSYLREVRGEEGGGDHGNESDFDGQ